MSIAEHVADGRCGCCGQSPPYWTPGRMVEALRAWVETHGRLPVSTHRNSSGEIVGCWLRSNPDHPTESHVKRVFGGWNRFVRAAGFEPRKACGQRRWTRDAIAEAMLDHLLSTGEWPTSRTWAAPKNGRRRPSAGTVFNVFGSWDDAKRYAGWTGETTVYVEPRCVECGTEIDNRTIGCKSCSDRANGRLQRARKAETAASPIPSAATVSDERKVSA